MISPLPSPSPTFNLTELKEIASHYFSQMWFKLSSLPFDPGVGYATCVLDNNLYMSGISLRKAYVLRYDPCSNMWEECCQMPEKRRYHEMVIVCNHVHAVCGWNKRDGVFTSIIQYHVSEDAWVSLGHLQVGVYSASACAVDNMIYVFGGRADDSTRKRDIQSFNVVTGQATVINQFPSAVTESRALSINSCMYLALTNGSIMKVMESGSLSRHSILPNFDRFNFGLLQKGSNILVVGGDTRYPSGSSQFVDILEVNSQDGSKVKILNDRLFTNASAAACRILLIRRVILPRLSVPGIPH